MPAELDHLLVPVRDRDASAERLASILGVPWSASEAGPFAAVFVNDGLTIDFDEARGEYPIQYYCFRVSESEFDAILARLIVADIDCRSTPHGPVDMQVGTHGGGRIACWNEPGGHVWEILTVSYARRASQRSAVAWTEGAGVVSLCRPRLHEIP